MKVPLQVHVGWRQGRGSWDQNSLGPEQPWAHLASPATKTICRLLGLYCGRLEAEGLLVHLVLGEKGGPAWDTEVL